MTLYFNAAVNRSDYETYIPGLWKYAQRLCGNKDCTRDLVCRTLDEAHQKRWKKSKNLPTEAWLTLLMVQKFYDTPAHLHAGSLH